MSIEVFTQEDKARWNKIKHLIPCSSEHIAKDKCTSHHVFLGSRFCCSCYLKALQLFYSPKPGQPGYRASTVDDTIGESRKLTVDEKKERKRAKRQIRKLKKAGKPIPQELLDKIATVKPITEVIEKQKEKKAEEFAEAEEKAKRSERRKQRAIRRKGQL